MEDRKPRTLGHRPVCFIASSDVLGGAEQYVLRLAGALRGQVDATVVSGPHSPVLTEAERLGLRTDSLRLGAKLGRRTAVANLARLPLARRRLRSTIERRGATGWCVLQFKWEELLWAGTVAPDSVCLLEHGPIPEALLRVPWARRRLRRAFERAAVVFASSRPATESIRALADREPVYVPAGVDPARAQAAVAGRGMTRERLGASEGDVLLAYAGRVVEDKGVLDVVRAVACLPRGRAVIAGDGPAARRVRRLAEDAGVSERVRLVGQVEDALPFLAAADATILLTRERGEGRPHLGIESLAVGTPVLGLASSPALRALAAEADGGVRLMDSREPRGVAEAALALRASGRTRRTWPSWDETAAAFLDALEPAQGSRTRR
jgi:glycosyltransferase involved in cell wall biosynthesis